MQMRVFFITHTYSLGGSGGGEQFASSFLHQLLKRNHDVFVFTAGGKQFAKKERQLGLQVYHCPVFGHHAFQKFQYLLMWWKAVLLARRFKPDVIHAQNDVFPGIIGWFVRLFTGRPLVCAVEYLSDQAVSLNLKTVFAVNRLLLPRMNFDAVVSWSEFVVKRLLLPWGIPKEKIAIVPGGVNVKAFLANNRPHPALAKDKNWIVSAKPLHTTNAAGIAYIVKAMAAVAKRHPNWCYAIVGGGQSRPMLEGLVDRLGLRKNVFFFGPMPSSQIASLYAASEIVAHSFAFKATTSIALMESMAAGKAIVATDSGEVKPTVADTALLARQKDEKSIANALLKLIENPRLRKQLGAAARQRAKQNYSIESVVTRFESLYKNILKEEPAKISAQSSGNFLKRG